MIGALVVVGHGKDIFDVGERHPEKQKDEYDGSSKAAVKEGWTVRPRFFGIWDTCSTERIRQSFC